MNNFKDLTILSLEQATVVPYLTYRMAMDGIKIIRLENPMYGDPNRFIGDNVLNEKGMNTYYLCINAGKKSLTVDLSKKEGKIILSRLISKLKVDIFITNQLPKNYVKLGIDYNSLKLIKNDIIWVGITGFKNNEPAYDPILQARSGLMDLTGESEGDPQILGIPLPDMGTSEHAYGSIMKALYLREKINKGSEINISMMESTMSWLTVPVTMSSTFNKKITRTGNTHSFFCPVSVFKTNDGYIYLAIGNNVQWNRMVATDIFNFLNKKDYEKNVGRVKDVDKIIKGIESVIINYSSKKIIKFFRDLSIPVSIINSVSDVIKDPFIKEKLIFAYDNKTKLKLSLAPAPYDTNYLLKNNRLMSFPPRFGENNNEILEKIGYTNDDIEKFKEKEII